jgi:hypothetical protein
MALQFPDVGGYCIAGGLRPVPPVVAVHRLDQADGGDLDQVVDGFASITVAASEVGRQRQERCDDLVSKRGTLRIVAIMANEMYQQRIVIVHAEMRVRDRGHRCLLPTLPLAPRPTKLSPAAQRTAIWRAVRAPDPVATNPHPTPLPFTVRAPGACTPSGRRNRRSGVDKQRSRIRRPAQLLVAAGGRMRLRMTTAPNDIRSTPSALHPLVVADGSLADPEC